MFYLTSFNSSKLLPSSLVRVTQKDEIRTYNNAKGSGKLFSFTVIDESCDLRVTAFNKYAEKYVKLYQNRVVSFGHSNLFRFEPMIKEGKCYSISNGEIKNKLDRYMYNRTDSDYELTLGRSSIIEPCVESFDG